MLILVRDLSDILVYISDISYFRFRRSYFTIESKSRKDALYFLGLVFNLGVGHLTRSVETSTYPESTRTTRCLLITL